MLLWIYVIMNFWKNDNLNQSILLIRIRTTTIINYLCSGEYDGNDINFHVFVFVLIIFPNDIFLFDAKPFIVSLLHLY